MASNFPVTGEISISPKTVCELEWKIPNFVSLLDRYERCYSPTFSFAGTFWNLAIWISYGYLHIALVRQSSISLISLEVSVGFKTSNGRKDRERYAQRIVQNGAETYRCISCLQKTEILNRKSDILPSNVLTVLCTVKSSKATDDIVDIANGKCSYCKDIVDTKAMSAHEKKCINKPIKCQECSNVVVLKNWYDHECQMAKAEGEPYTSTSSSILQGNKVLKDLKEFYLKKENCDVIIKVQGQEFPAHKAILEARSSVLASTFRNDMKEKATGVVEIEDCDPSSFSDFLCFLYCGEMKVISKQNVFSLFMAGDKYDVQDLRAQCVKFMKETLSVDTFCDTITLGLRHSETDLIKLTTDFFIENAKAITLTVKWQSFLAENPTHSNELIIKLLASK